MKSWKKINVGLRFMMDKYKVMQDQKQKQRHIYIVKPESDIGGFTVRIFHEEGVHLMLGTDAPVPFTVPGWSVHQELANLVGAGLSPYEALRTATLHPARWLGQADRAGTLAVGKQADLLLVGGNPLDAVSHAANPLGVMTRGRWLPRTELERLLGPPRR
jgi:imidazolonepropionase-like amidohydrolase